MDNFSSQHYVFFFVFVSISNFSIHNLNNGFFTAKFSIYSHCFLLLVISKHIQCNWVTVSMLLFSVCSFWIVPDDDLYTKSHCKRINSNHKHFAEFFNLQWTWCKMVFSFNSFFTNANHKNTEKTTYVNTHFKHSGLNMNHKVSYK